MIYLELMEYFAKTDCSSLILKELSLISGWFQRWKDGEKRRCTFFGL